MAQRISFTGRLVAVQLCVVLLALGVAVGISAILARQAAWSQAEGEALRVAHTIAADPDVRVRVAAEAAKDTLDPAALRTGPIQAEAEAVRERSGLLFVVITDEHGLRLSHPNPTLIGQRVSTDPQALDGRDHVLRERGTLGDSVRGKVPVFAPETSEVVGEVSVGLGVRAVAEEAQAAAWPIVAGGAAMLALAGLAGWWLARRLRRATLGLGPEEVVQLVRDQEAVLHGVDEGVVGLSASGRVTVVNPSARELLGSEEQEKWPQGVRDAIRDQVSGPLRVRSGERVLVLRRRAVNKGGRDLGAVITLRDLTDVEDLGMRLEGVETMAQALRVQRHEFANRLHALSGLLARGAVAEAEEYLRSITGQSQIGADVPQLELIGDTYLSAFLGAKAVQAAERGVQLRVGERSDVAGRVRQAQDVTAVLGNLLDNAVNAVTGPGAGGEHAASSSFALPGEWRGWVEVDLIADGNTLHLAVVDSGPGIAAGLDVFGEGVSGRAPDGEGHGLGVGLPLARRLARRAGGEVWLADAGGVQSDGERVGAVFAARLPRVMEDGA